MALHFYGIRHHGPGSSRHLLRELEMLKPDLIVLEGPHESEHLLSWVSAPGMCPPVALLSYAVDEPGLACFYPFADFSPEWQSIRYAQRCGVELRMFDLPMSVRLAMLAAERRAEALRQEAEESEPEQTEQKPVRDPLTDFAISLGYPDGESWWEATIEHRQDGTQVFEAVATLMAELRASYPDDYRPEDHLREAYMRRCLRLWEQEGYERIAVVCGAWHVPALTASVPIDEDEKLLRSLPHVGVESTWIAWTYGHLSSYLGYGAGVKAPGWYDYLWHHPEDDGALWVGRMAELLRRERFDVSVAHVIDTLRLAHMTANLRGLIRPTMQEYNEALVAVVGMGEATMLRFIEQELLVSNRLGTVPMDVPKIPLLVDVEQRQRRLRLPFTAEHKRLTLDLRKPIDLERSVLLHRFGLLDIPWANEQAVRGKGTFKEGWLLTHEPEHIALIIERGIWGETLETALVNYLNDQLGRLVKLAPMVSLLSRAIPADLPGLVAELTQRVYNMAVSTTDVLEILETFPMLVDILRYGSVRDLDFSPLRNLLYSLVVRSTAAGIVLCQGIDLQTAQGIQRQIGISHQALFILQDEEINSLWIDYLKRLCQGHNVQPLLQGYATRLLREILVHSSSDTASILRRYVSAATAPMDIASWLEGFLSTSGEILLVDDELWGMVYNWLAELEEETFVLLLPVLRRCFGSYTSHERRKIAERAARGVSGLVSMPIVDAQAYDHEGAGSLLLLMHRLLGLNAEACVVSK